MDTISPSLESQELQPPALTLRGQVAQISARRLTTSIGSSFAPALVIQFFAVTKNCVMLSKLTPITGVAVELSQ